MSYKYVLILGFRKWLPHDDVKLHKPLRKSSEMNELPADLTLLQQELYAVQYMYVPYGGNLSR